MEKTRLSSSTALAEHTRVLLVGTTILWGLSFPLTRGLELAQRVAAPHVSDAAIACADIAMRFCVAALMLLPFFGRNLLRVTGREWSQAVGLALFAGIGLGLQTLGLEWTDASIAAFLTQLYTLVVPLIVAVRDRRAPTLRVVAACILVLAGAALLSPGLLRHFILGPGEFVIILSTILIAGQIVWVERPVYAENRTGLVTVLMFFLIAIMFSLAYFVVGGTATDAKVAFGTPAILILSLSLVVFCTAANFLIMNAYQRFVSATEAGLIYCIEPVVASVLAGFLPGWMSRLAGIAYANEVVTWNLFFGGALIIIATVLVATEKRAPA